MKTLPQLFVICALWAAVTGSPLFSSAKNTDTSPWDLVKLFGRFSTTVENFFESAVDEINDCFDKIQESFTPGTDDNAKEQTGLVKPVSVNEVVSPSEIVPILVKGNPTQAKPTEPANSGGTVSGGSGTSPQPATQIPTAAPVTEPTQAADGVGVSKNGSGSVVQQDEVKPHGILGQLFG